MRNKLSHTNSNGEVSMVDVSSKEETLRTAEASCKVKISKETARAVKNNLIKKGDVFAAARIAGISAAKRTSELIPLCHNIFLSKVSVELKLDEKARIVNISSSAKSSGKTGVEMEALTAVTVAALTVYDMCKAIDRSVVITDIKLISKTGGKSGNYKAK